MTNGSGGTTDDGTPVPTVVPSGSITIITMPAIVVKLEITTAQCRTKNDTYNLIPKRCNPSSGYSDVPNSETSELDKEYLGNEVVDVPGAGLHP